MIGEHWGFTHPASVSAPVEGQQPAWRLSVAPGPAHALQAEVPEKGRQGL